jgi:hypothetical protein
MLRHEFQLNNTQRFTLYLTENTLCLHYKYHPVNIAQSNHVFLYVCVRTE